jgi:hypothetical protein
MMPNEPSSDERYMEQRGRDHAVDMILALLIVAIAANHSRQTTLPDFIQNMMDIDLDSDSFSEMYDRYGREATDAFREAAISRGDHVLELARTFLARIHQMRHPPKDDE